MENNENTNTSSFIQEDVFNVREFIHRCFVQWYWFVISLVVCLLAGAYIYLTTVPVYHSTAEVQIKSDARGRSYDNSNEFSSMGLFTTRTIVYNELRAFKSPDIVSEVVDMLKLYMDYKTVGRRYAYTLYGTSLPIEAEFVGADDLASASFNVSVTKDGNLFLSNFVNMGEKVKDKTVTGSFGDTLTTPIGSVVVNKTAYYPASGYRRQIIVTRDNKRVVSSSYVSKLQVDLSDKMADVITLGINDVSTQRAQDFLSTLISVYNVKWVQDKNMLANATSEFINERLKVIEGELAGVDSDISAFKSANMIPNVDAAADMYMQQGAAINQQIQSLNNQLSMARYVKNYLASEGGNNQPLPANLGITNSSIDSRINEYNAQLIKRNNLVDNSGVNNVLVKDMDKSLATMRESISQSVENEILSLNTQYTSLQNQARKNAAKISANPNQARELLSVERQQGVKQSLYLYLLQKREENELSQAFTAYNTRIIKHPITAGKVAPQRNRIFLIALVLGLFFPFAILFLLTAFDTKVRGRKDLKGLSLPSIGEIPLASKKKNFFKRMKRTAVTDNTIVVKPGSRNMVNEAFRVMRTNLEFMTKDPSSNVIALTSFNPGSGKSFLSANLAVCLAIKDKKVLVVDGDLRRGTLSAIVNSPEKGLSDYLACKVDDIRDVILKHPDYPSMDVIPIGTVPPNPAELIADPRFGEAIDVLKKEYSYVIIDCPPIDIVTDARVINTYVDRTVFVLRAGLLDKDFLPELEKLYKLGEYKNLCFVLNGTTSTGSYYSSYGRYGSYYGHYGHYGYYGSKG